MIPRPSKPQNPAFFVCFCRPRLHGVLRAQGNVVCCFIPLDSPKGAPSKNKPHKPEVCCLFWLTLRQFGRRARRTVMSPCARRTVHPPRASLPQRAYIPYMQGKGGQEIMRTMSADDIIIALSRLCVADKHAVYRALCADHGVVDFDASDDRSAGAGKMRAHRSARRPELRAYTVEDFLRLDPGPKRASR